MGSTWSDTYAFRVAVKLSSFASIAVTRIDRMSYESQWVNKSISTKWKFDTNTTNPRSVISCISHIVVCIVGSCRPSPSTVPAAIL